nr:hypothetical protein [uncultured bacterium]
MSLTTLVAAANCSHSFSRYSLGTGPSSSFQILCSACNSLKARPKFSSVASASAFFRSFCFFSKLYL